MLVVSDASPLNVLIRTELVSLLEKLFGRVVIPSTVADELSHPHTPLAVREWVAARPSWLEIRSATLIDSRLDLDAGEREAISLATELHADLLLVDDLKARRVARRLGLVIIGTIGVLELGAERGLVDLREALNRIRQTDFRIADDLLDEALRRDEQRGTGPPAAWRLRAHSMRMELRGLMSHRS